MKIALVCSHGGHLTELLYLMDAFKDHDVFFVTYNNFRTEKLDYPKYLMKNIGTNPIRMLQSFFKFIQIFRREKPDIIISTGSEIAIPAIFLAKILRKKTIFIESWCRVKTKSATGKMIYYISDEFLVQWPQLLEIYGDKAKYKGAVI